MTLTAMSRCSRSSRARYTSPIPPCPSGSRISYGPRRVPFVNRIGLVPEPTSPPIIAVPSRHDGLPRAAILGRFGTPLSSRRAMAAWYPLADARRGYPSRRRLSDCGLLRRGLVSRASSPGRRPGGRRFGDTRRPSVEGRRPRSRLLVARLRRKDPRAWELPRPAGRGARVVRESVYRRLNGPVPVTP